MKAVLEYELPEDNVPHLMAIAAEGAHYVISELDESLRGYLRHGHQFKTPGEALTHVRELLRSLCHDNDVTQVFN